MDPTAVFLAARTTARSIDELTAASPASARRRRASGWPRLTDLDRHRR